MGRVIKPDTEGAATAALTETGKGGLLSKGYLRDDPAGEYVGDGETPAYVVTNASEGVVRTRDGQETAITPGDGYRTIAVVTDRRIIGLVGNADDGDERITLPLVEVAGARTTDGHLVVDMDTGDRWRIHAGDGGVDDVGAYVDDAATAWEDVESSLDAVKRRLVEATAHRDDGEYDAGIEAAQAAYDELADAVAVVDAFDDAWPATALRDRVDSVRTRCVSTLADVRVGNGRAIADRGEERWRDGEYEAAHDTYDRARAEFEAVAALDVGRHDQTDAVADGLDRIDRAIEDLRETPLERAIEVDRRAADAEDLPEAIADWELARERYLETLALDADDPERRFAGEPAKIRERVETVTERVVEVARGDGTDALEAGQWYLEAGKPTVAHDELRVARDIFERALPVTRDGEPSAVDDVEAWLAEAEAALEEVDAGDGGTQNAAVGEDDTRKRDIGEDGGQEAADAADEDVGRPDPSASTTGPGPSEEPGPSGDCRTADEAADDDRQDADASRKDGDGRRDVGLTFPGPAADAIAPIDATNEGSDGEQAAVGERATDGDRSDGLGSGGIEGQEPVVSDGAGATIDAPPADSSFESHLRALDPDGFGRLARSLLEADGLEPTPADDGEPYDFHVAGADDGNGLLVRTIHRPLGGPIDADELRTTATAADLRDAAAMLVTSSSLAEDAADVATEAGVRVIAGADIEAALDGRSPDPFGRERIAVDD